MIISVPHLFSIEIFVFSLYFYSNNEHLLNTWLKQFSPILYWYFTSYCRVLTTFMYVLNGY